MKRLIVHLQPHLTYTSYGKNTFVLVEQYNHDDLCDGCAFYDVYGATDRHNCRRSNCTPIEVDAEKNYVWKRLL